MKKPIKTCKHCKKQYKSDNVSFCSKECKYNFFQEQNKKTCVICDNIFYEKRKTSTKTCSKVCNSKLRTNNLTGKIIEDAWEIRSCPICTTEFKIRIKYERIYCSPECRRTHYLNNKETIDTNKIIKQKKTLLERYGFESIMHVPEFFIKNRETHNNKTPEQIQQMVSKAKQTKFEKYGDENYRDINKRKITCLAKYGDENYNNRPKFMETIIERYGDYHLRLPEYKERYKNTFMEKYGVTGVLAIKENHKKAESAHLTKYGGTWYQNSEEFTIIKNKSQSKVIDERLDRFGFTWLESNKFITFSKTRYLKIQCKKCNNIMHTTLIKNNEKPICRKCFPSSKYSSINLFAQDYIKSIYDGEMLTNNRSLIRPYEIDIFLSEYQIGFEMDGNYFHSTGFGGKETDYHIMKTKLAHDKGIRMIHIFEDEVEYNGRVLKSFIDRTLGKSKLIQYPQDLDININIDVDVRINFIKENSLYDYIKSDFDIVLSNGDDIIYMVCIRVDSNNNFTIVNEITKLNYNIINGFNLIINHILETHDVNRLKYISNIRLNGLGYLDNKFKSISITKPNKYFINKVDYYHRARRINDALLKMIYNNIVYYISDENQMDGIYDCGSEVFEYIQ
jgi:hypothetical protein